MLGHETSLGKFRTEITSSIVSDHNHTKLKINYKKKIRVKYKHVEAEQRAIIYSMVWWRNQGGNKKYIEPNENGNNNLKSGTQQK